MNRKSFIKLLAAHDLCWQEKFEVDSGQELRWVKVFEWKHHEYGISSDGAWREACLENQLSHESNFMSFLSILELSRSDALALLRSEITRLGLPDSVIRTFPFDQVMLMGLKMMSDYWAEKVKNWLDNGYPMSAQIAVEFPDLPQVASWQKQRLEKILNA